MSKHFLDDLKWSRKRDPPEAERYEIRKNRLKLRYDPKTSSVSVALLFDVKKERGNQYRVVFAFPLDGTDSIKKMTASSKTRIGCNCPDFLYRQAYLFNKTKNLYNPSSYGLAIKLPPVRTNPQYKKRICKHLKMVWKIIRDLKLTELYSKSLTKRVIFYVPKLRR